MDDTQAHSVTAQQVIDYLAAHPDFFNQYPACLETLQLNDSPQGTISLLQKQNERLQQKNAQLQAQLQTLIETARQNTALQARVHQLCLRLMDAPSFGTLLPLLMKALKQEFKADEVALRWFYTSGAAALPETQENVVSQRADDAQLQLFEKILTQRKPVCGRLSKAQKQVLFANQADKVQSAACLPLGHNPCAGLLVIASYDEHRFHAEMATDYLTFLAEVTMRLLRPHHDFSQ